MLTASGASQQCLRDLQDETYRMKKPQKGPVKGVRLSTHDPRKARQRKGQAKKKDLKKLRRLLKQQTAAEGSKVAASYCVRAASTVTAWPGLRCRCHAGADRCSRCTGPPAGVSCPVCLHAGSLAALPSCCPPLHELERLVVAGLRRAASQKAPASLQLTR